MLILSSMLYAAPQVVPASLDSIRLEIPAMLAALHIVAAIGMPGDIGESTRLESALDTVVVFVIA